MSRGRGAALDPDVPKICAVCGAAADGYHYGTMSCRSCNAFFRRSVMEKAEYTCRHNLQCIIDEAGRNACRFCRYRKCVNAGMKIEAVQPRRDPTGSQANRRRPINRDSISSFGSPETPRKSSCLPEMDENGLPIGIRHLPCPIPMKPGALDDSPTSYVSDLNSMIKRELEDQDDRVPDDAEPPPSSSNTYTSAPKKYAIDSAQTNFQSEPDHHLLQGNSRTAVCPVCPSGNCCDDQIEFTLLVESYKDHTRHMQLCFASPESFLKELCSGPNLRKMEPTDVEKLSNVELAGLLFWIEKISHFKLLPPEDRANLLKRYSVRKLSLDHFYSAARNSEHARKRKFVMNNYTYVPPEKTGFETPQDDERQMTAKKEAFAPTFDRFWNNLVDRFIDMKISDAEIVFLHLLLLWSPLNQSHVSEQMRPVLQSRREWAMRRIAAWYAINQVPDAELRLGEMIFLFQELETVCDLHCQDFLVAKMFDFCDLSDFWYETICYGPLNTSKPVSLHSNASDVFKVFAAAGYMMRVGADVQLYPSSKAPPGQTYTGPLMETSSYSPAQMLAQMTATPVYHQTTQLPPNVYNPPQFIQ